MVSRDMWMNYVREEISDERNRVLLQSIKVYSEVYSNSSTRISRCWQLDTAIDRIIDEGYHVGSTYRERHSNWSWNEIVPLLMEKMGTTFKTMPT
jgi:hypothetical protein